MRYRCSRPRGDVDHCHDAPGAHLEQQLAANVDVDVDVDVAATLQRRRWQLADDRDVLAGPDDAVDPQAVPLLDRVHRVSPVRTRKCSAPPAAARPPARDPEESGDDGSESARRAGTRTLPRPTWPQFRNHAGKGKRPGPCSPGLGRLRRHGPDALHNCQPVPTHDGTRLARALDESERSVARELTHRGTTWRTPEAVRHGHRPVRRHHRRLRTGRHHVRWHRKTARAQQPPPRQRAARDEGRIAPGPCPTPRTGVAGGVRPIVGGRGLAVNEP